MARIEVSRLASAARQMGGDPAADPVLLGEPAVRIPATREGTGLSLPGTLPWGRSRFLAMTALADGDHAGEVVLGFFADGEGQARLRVSIALFPGLPTRLVLPLSVLDGQTVLLPRTPGRLKAVVSGRRIDPDEIDHVLVQLERTAGPQSLHLGAISLTTREPRYSVPRRALVDDLGQWRGRDWPDKTPDDAYLGTDIDYWRERSARATRPEGFCRLGGTNLRTFGPSGFFHLQHDGTRWWLVDPEGHGFFSLGLGSVRPGEATAVVPGAEELLGALPARTGPLAGAWTPSPVPEGAESYSFGLANLIRSFGPAWLPDWTAMTRGRLVAWRFNTVAGASDPGFLRSSGLPYVVSMPAYPVTAVSLYRDFPDVFSPEFRSSAREYARELEPYRHDPKLIGYFMGNSPDWALGRNNLASEMLEGPPGTATRRELARRLRERYGGDAGAWARAWGLSLARFEEIVTARVRGAASRSETARADLWEFSKAMVRAYVRVPAEECRRVDPNHLNLGMRYAGIPSELVFEAAEWLSVFSIDADDMLPPADAIAQISETTRRPVLLAGFHFGALDRGLPATGRPGVASQEERGVAYRRYVETAAASPHVVGTHYAALHDDELLGGADGESFQVGFVDVCHRPYRELAEAATLTHERVYEILAGRVEPYAREAREITPVGF